MSKNLGVYVRKLLFSRKHIESVVSRLSEKQLQVCRKFALYCAVAKRRTRPLIARCWKRSNDKCSKAPFVEARSPVMEEPFDTGIVRNELNLCKNSMKTRGDPPRGEEVLANSYFDEPFGWSIGIKKRGLFAAVLCQGKWDQVSPYVLVNWGPNTEGS